MTFVDRAEAGRRLGESLEHRRDGFPVVVGVQRGGVPVAAEVARVLRAPFDVIGVRRLVAPFQPQLTMGAVGEHGMTVVDERLARTAGLTSAEIAVEKVRCRAELRAMPVPTWHGTEQVPLRGRSVIVVDDGVATGSTAEVACRIVRARGATSVLLAVPVAPRDVVPRLRGCADDLVVLEHPPWFSSIGASYRQFAAVTDEAIIDARARRRIRSTPVGAAHSASVGPWGRDVPIDLGSVRLFGYLVPAGGPLVVVANAAANARHGSSLRLLSAELNNAGFSTLSCDLLLPVEELDRANVTDAHLLARRMEQLSGWLGGHPEITDRCPASRVGFLGVGAASPAVLLAAAQIQSDIGAVVCAGGSPGAARPWLGRLEVPALLITRRPAERLPGPSKIAEVTAGRRIFDRPEGWRTIADLAVSWFLEHLEPTLLRAV